MNEYCIKYGLNEERIPRHVAIIMDGNGRWAKKRLRNRLIGHRAGADSVDAITTLCRETGIEYLTLYTFSTENWNRPESEVSGLMNLFREYLKSKKSLLIEKNIRLNIIGEKERFAPDLLELMNETIEATKQNPWKMTLTLALGYGSRQEITAAVKKIAEKVSKNEIRPENIDEKFISENLYTFDMPDPDLVIRTSGEYRISNYLLWQIAYSEFYFTDTLWPDFREDELVKALKDYAGRERRFGKTGDQIKS